MSELASPTGILLILILIGVGASFVALLLKYGALLKQIEALETEQTELTERMMDPSFFGGGTSDAVQEVTARLEEITGELAERYERWETLEELRESLES